MSVYGQGQLFPSSSDLVSVLKIWSAVSGPTLLRSARRSTPGRGSEVRANLNVHLKKYFANVRGELE